jgi:hypothetical protein
MIRADSMSERFRVKTSRIVSKLMVYARIASPIYASWGIDTDSYYENCLMSTSKRFLKEDQICHE